MYNFPGGRRLEVWAYDVSHKRLLLRSAMSEKATTRVDLYFHDVAALRVRNSMTVDRIVEAESGSASEIRAVAGVPADDDHACFVLECSEGDGYVIASFCQISEDSGDSDQRSPHWSGELPDSKIKRMIWGSR